MPIHAGYTAIVRVNEGHPHVRPIHEGAVYEGQRQKRCIREIQAHRDVSQVAVGTQQADDFVA